MYYPSTAALKMLYLKRIKWNKEMEINTILTHGYIDHELIPLKCEQNCVKMKYNAEQTSFVILVK